MNLRFINKIDDITLKNEILKIRHDKTNPFRKKILRYIKYIIKNVNKLDKITKFEISLVAGDVIVVKFIINNPSPLEILIVRCAEYPDLLNGTPPLITLSEINSRPSLNNIIFQNRVRLPALFKSIKNSLYN